VSIRISQNEFLVTPSGMPYDTMTLDQIVPVKISPAQYKGEYKPTSEWQIHLAVYKRFPWNDAGAVVHTHSHYSTTIACMRRRIPAFHYMVMVAGS
jgi:L-fuculose-phosphate aldolase